MSSVTRFIRQKDLAAKYYSASSVIGANAAAVPAAVAANCYELNSGSVVGNYPAPAVGFMILGSSALQTAIAQVVNANGNNSANLCLRDMGKTIRAPVTSATGSQGFFRQVQLLNPVGVSSYLGGTSGNVFGVNGAAATPDAYTNYLTFYIPIVVDNLNVNQASTFHNIPSGQM